MKCKSCGKEIVFLRTEKGKYIPINADSSASEDIYFNKDRHISHFADCPAADKFRKVKK